ncbi:MAG: Do family serine endopeptidase [Bradyrhizobiaceae bacterium]|nr:Do family serine endopeptidase [Bradyrhizobiaceae bacterium]
MSGLLEASSIHRRGRTAAMAWAVMLAAGLLAGSAAVAQQRGPASVADVAEKVLDAVVNISTSQTVSGRQAVPTPQVPPGSPFEEFFEEFFKRRGEDDSGRPRRVSSLGSGFVIDAEGIIVTNNHVIADADEIFANFNDGAKLKAEVIGRDTKTDIAVLRVKPEKPLKAVPFGDSDRLRVGDWVMAIGNPFNLGGSVSVGVVSARNRDINAGPYDNFIQTDAAINRGNSGGPLFNMDGEVVGVNTAIISPSGGSIGIGFSIPSKTAVAVIGQLREFGETRRGWIGVRIQQVDDQIAETLGLGRARGALVAGVTEGGPAEKAGVLAGDVIVKFNNQDVREMRDLPRVVADTPVGRSVDVVVVRKGKEQTLQITLGRLEDSEKPQQAAAKAPGPEQKSATRRLLGVELSAINDELRKRFKLKEGVKGIVIVSVESNSPLADQRVQAGDVIVEVTGEAVGSPADLQKRLDALKKDGRKSALLLLTNSAGEQRFVPVTIP